MKSMLVLLILLLIPNNYANNAGTILFRDKIGENCWSWNELAKLRARKAFEELVSIQVTADKVNTNFIKNILLYFQTCFDSIENGEEVPAPLLREALADTIGGHLRSELLPTIRLAYYAGYVPYRDVRQIHDFYDHLKIQMNTQGIGWKLPKRSVTWYNLTVARILIGPAKLFNPCARLVTKRDKNSCIHFPSPKLDDKKDPSAIALPFKKGGLNNLLSQSAENLLLKYYTTASRCILDRSPKHCRHSDFVNFNNELWHWMKKDVAPHLMDEKLYTGFSGVLRIAAAVQNYGKGLSRRNIYDVDDGYTKAWSPLKTFPDRTFCINTDWTPKLYVSLIAIVGIVICLLQMCYGAIFSYLGRCRCGPRKDATPVPRYDADVPYDTVDSNLPAVLPSHSARSSKSEGVGPESTIEIKENPEQDPVIMNACDATDIDLTSITSRDSDEEYVNSTVIEITSGNRSRDASSPPMIDPSVTHLKINKASMANRSNYRYQEEVGTDDTGWTGSLTSASPRSVSSSSDKQTTRSHRKCRDLAWARRVLYKQTTQTPRSRESYTPTPSHRQY